MDIPAVDGRCDECGFDYDAFETEDLVSQLDGLAGTYGDVISRCSDAELRRRPAPEVWSILEYTCHMRDVLEIQRERVTRALAEDEPVFPRAQMWQWPERHGYNASDPPEVLRVLGENASALAATVHAIAPAQLERTLVYSYPEPTERTVGWLLRHTGHEGMHHLFDIERIATRAR